MINGWPIGVTLHVIDERIDAGRILRRQRVPVYPTDDLKAVADRTYQVECDLLSDFGLWLQSADPDWQVDVAEHPLSKRRVSTTRVAARRDIRRESEPFIPCRRPVGPTASPRMQPRAADKYCP